MNDNFIEHKDPTAPLDSGLADSIIFQTGSSLEAEYNKLTPEERLLVACRCLGMNHVPTDVHTFIFDDYFLGGETITNHGRSVFPYWLDKFEKIFPTPVSTKTPYISLSGAIGIGKTSIVRYLGLYMYHRLDCCTNIYKSLKLAGGVKISFAFFHSSYETCLRDVIQYFKFVFDTSPYFRSLYNNPPIRLIASGPQSTSSIIGTNMIFSAMSELGFWRPKDAKSRVDEVLTRYESRFRSVRDSFGLVIADSSAKDSDRSAMEKFCDAVPKEELFSSSASQFEVRPELWESGGKTFDFYIGDTIQEPRIVEDGEDIIKSGLDPDRIRKVPLAAKFRFLSDPIRSTRDLLGIPVNSNELFFNNNLSHLIRCSSLKNYAPEEVIVDFYDKSDSIFSHVSSMIYRIPRGTSLFLHYDIGIKKDRTGVSLCYYAGEKTMPDGSSFPEFKFPLLFVVSRKKGQSTSLDHLMQFIRDLIKSGYQVTVSADSFASAGLFQSCEREGIEYKCVSMDKTMDAGNLFKNVINTERAILPYNNILLRECSEIRIVSNGKNNDHLKLDHPDVSSCTEFDYKDKQGDHPGTKDLFDSACGALYSCYNHYAEYLETGTAGGVGKTVSAINSLTADPREEAQKRFQGMLESLF